MRTTGENQNFYEAFLQMGVHGGIDFRTLVGATTIDRDTPFLLWWDPGGASRAITLPAAERGLMFLVINAADAAEDLTFAGTVAAGTISQNEAGLFVSDGVVWKLVLVGGQT